MVRNRVKVDIDMQKVNESAQKRLEERVHNRQNTIGGIVQQRAPLGRGERVRNAEKSYKTAAQAGVVEFGADVFGGQGDAQPPTHFQVDKPPTGFYCGGCSAYYVGRRDVSCRCYKLCSCGRLYQGVKCDRADTGWLNNSDTKATPGDVICSDAGGVVVADGDQNVCCPTPVAEQPACTHAEPLLIPPPPYSPKAEPSSSRRREQEWMPNGQGNLEPQRWERKARLRHTRRFLLNDTGMGQDDLGWARVEQKMRKSGWGAARLDEKMRKYALSDAKSKMDRYVRGIMPQIRANAKSERATQCRKDAVERAQQASKDALVRANYKVEPATLHCAVDREILRLRTADSLLRAGRLDEPSCESDAVGLSALDPLVLLPMCMLVVAHVHGKSQDHSWYTKCLMALHCCCALLMQFVVMLCAAICVSTLTVNANVTAVDNVRVGCILMLGGIVTNANVRAFLMEVQQAIALVCWGSKATQDKGEYLCRFQLVTTLSICTATGYLVAVYARLLQYLYICEVEQMQLMSAQTAAEVLDILDTVPVITQTHVYAEGIWSADGRWVGRRGGSGCKLGDANKVRGPNAAGGDAADACETLRDESTYTSGDSSCERTVATQCSVQIYSRCHNRLRPAAGLCALIFVALLLSSLVSGVSAISDDELDGVATIAVGAAATAATAVVGVLRSSGNGDGSAELPQKRKAVRQSAGSVGDVHGKLGGDEYTIVDSSDCINDAATKGTETLSPVGACGNQYDVGDNCVRAKALYNSKKYLSAFTLYKSAANAGDANAQMWVGFMYFHGQGVVENYKEALVWHQKAAKQGNPGAMKWITYYNNPVNQCNRAGKFHAAGDYTAAFELYRLSAGQGDALAQGWLGHMYLHGQSVRKNNRSALVWYQKSAAQGNAQAKAAVDVIAERLEKQALYDRKSRDKKRVQKAAVTAMQEDRPRNSIELDADVLGIVKAAGSKSIEHEMMFVNEIHEDSENNCESGDDPVCDSGSSDDSCDGGDGDGCDDDDDADGDDEAEEVVVVADATARGAAVADGTPGGGPARAADDIDMGAWGNHLPTFPDLWNKRDSDKYDNDLHDTIEATSKKNAAKLHGKIKKRLDQLKVTVSCLCCGCRRAAADCVEILLAEPVPNHLLALTVLERWKVPPGVRCQYELSTGVHHCDESWTALLVATNAVKGPKITISNECNAEMLSNAKKKAMKTKFPEKAICNGRWYGHKDYDQQLKALGDGCWILMNSGANIYTEPMQYIYLNGNKTGRPNLVGHLYVRQLSPSDIVHAIETGTSPTEKVIIVANENDSKEAVKAAVQRAKVRLTVDKAKFMAAVGFLRANNPKFKLVEATLPKDLDSLPDTNVSVIYSNMNRPVDVSSTDPGDRAQTVIDVRNIPRTTAVISMDTVAAAENETFSVRDIVYQSKAYFKNWEKGCEYTMYMDLFPHGVGGPSQARDRPLSLANFVKWSLQDYNNQFATHKTWMIERFDRISMEQTHHVRASHMRNNPRLWSDINSVSDKDMKSAAAYIDACTRANALNQKKPTPPAGYNKAAEDAHRSALASTSYRYGSAGHARRMRNSIYDTMLFYGNGSGWFTWSVNDMVTDRYFEWCGANSEDPLFEKQVMLAANPTACALLHIEEVNLFIKYGLGYDVVTRKPIKGGGILGKIIAFAGPSESQGRGTLHCHILAVLRGMPCSPAQLANWIRDTPFLLDLFTLFKQMQHHGLGISESELMAQAAKAPECDDVGAGGIASDMGAGLPDAGVRCDVKTGCLPQSWYVTELPEDALYPKPVAVKDKPYPEVLACNLCNSTTSPYSAALNWAKEINPDAGKVFESERAEKQSGMSGVEFDVQSVLDDDGKFDTTVGTAVQRAVATFMNTQVNVHAAGHVSGCFKNNKGQCRMRRPFNLIAAVDAIIINDGEFVITEKLALEWMASGLSPLIGGTAELVEFETGVSPYFAYTGHFSMWLTALFGNNNVQIVSAGAGVVGYLVKYAGKHTADSNEGAKVYDAAKRSRQKDVALLQDGSERSDQQRAMAQAARMCYASIGTYDVSGTLIAMYFQNDGDIFHFSNPDFAKVPLKALMLWIQDKLYRCGTVTTGDDTIQRVDPIADFLHRGQILNGLCVYQYYMYYTKRKLGKTGAKNIAAGAHKKYDKVMFESTHTQYTTQYMKLCVNENMYHIPHLLGVYIPNNTCMDNGDDDRAREYMLTIIALFDTYNAQNPPFRDGDCTFEAVQSVYRNLMARVEPWVFRIMENAQGKHDGKIAANIKARQRAADAKRHYGGEAVVNERHVASERDLEKLADFEYSHDLPIKMTAGTSAAITMRKKHSKTTLGKSQAAAVKAKWALAAFEGGDELKAALQGEFDVNKKMAVEGGGAAGSDGIIPPPVMNPHDESVIFIVFVESIVVKLWDQRDNVTGTVLDIDDIEDFACPLDIAATYGIDKEPKQFLVYRLAVVHLLERYVKTISIPADYEGVPAILQMLNRLRESLTAEQRPETDAASFYYVGGAGYVHK